MTARQGNDPDTLRRHFGRADSILPLWIAEPDVALAPPIRQALENRAASGWYGYETRPSSIIESFWSWMSTRHSWDGSELLTTVSPSIGSSIGSLIKLFTDPGDGVILQPPVFTDFKTIITSAGRSVVRNPLLLRGNGYEINFEELEAKASEPTTRMLILCSPHNPVGRVWREDELRAVATICSNHSVFVIADEIHSDITLAPHSFHPFALASTDLDLAWAATHGPIKTFGLAGACDTLLITNSAEITRAFETLSSQLHLTRNNAFGLAAFEAAYNSGSAWLNDFLNLISQNVKVLQDELPSEVQVLTLEGTYLAWLDFRQLGFEVSELPIWLANSAGLALSPGHWFGREGAGFARMTIASPTTTIEQAAQQLSAATSRL